jgi:hypothetical protein
MPRFGKPERRPYRQQGLGRWRTFGFLMKPKTEELLNLLLWSVDMFLRPTFHNLTNSYESWAYRNGLLRRISRLEEQQFVERDRAWKDERLYRLTTRGRLHVLGGRDPEERSSRKWDGYWRLVLFDVPTTQNTRRTQLRRYLRNRGFGYLQNSVWDHNRTNFNKKSSF